MTELTYAAVMGKGITEGQVIGYILNAPRSLKSIKIAGCYTINDDAVNVSTHKVSHSKRNIKKAMYTQPVSFHKASGTYTFHYVDETL